MASVTTHIHAFTVLCSRIGLAFILVAALLGLLHILWTATYNVLFHPLRKYPGPGLCALTRIPYSRMELSGSAPYQMLELHRSHPDAMKGIRGRRKAGAPEHQKDPFRDILRNNILGADRANHTRYRSILAKSFSHQSILAKQPIINKHVDKLIQQLDDCCAGGTQKVDIMRWLSFTTFDIIGDLSFGESFGCLDRRTYHPWVELIFTSFKNRWYLSTLKRYPLLFPLLQRFVMPASLATKYSEHRRLSAAKVQQRLSTVTNRPDFMACMTSNDGLAALSFDELVSNATVLIAAGSETTATAVTAAVYYLARQPKLLAKVAAEVRSAFATEAEIDLLSVHHLTYMLAVLDEAMRLCPPAPGGQPRVIGEGGDTILGQYVAQGTFVEVWQWAVYHDPAHFGQPEAFIPERWLGDTRFDNDKREAFQPFSVGPRDCIGKKLAYSEMRLILARLIWQFDIELAQDSIGWDERNRFYMAIEKGPVNRAPRKSRFLWFASGTVAAAAARVEGKDSAHDSRGGKGSAREREAEAAGGALPCHFLPLAGGAFCRRWRCLSRETSLA
ncbi:hypothetical protein CDD83_7197 [Cordyceps sp. RAO-2017]|nr:hypothetical protein CDD83_7197 [Cordyceps sp. RAO-2017]